MVLMITACDNTRKMAMGCKHKLARNAKYRSFYKNLSVFPEGGGKKYNMAECPYWKHKSAENSKDMTSSNF